MHEDDAPDTDRDPRPPFRTLRLKVPIDRGVMPFIRAMGDFDGYAVHHVNREGEDVEITLPYASCSRSIP